MVYAIAMEDTSEGAVVQRKGRFKVTSADLSPKVYFQAVLHLLCVRVLTNFTFKFQLLSVYDSSNFDVLYLEHSVVRTLKLIS